MDTWEHGQGIGQITSKHSQRIAFWSDNFGVASFSKSSWHGLQLRHMASAEQRLSRYPDAIHVGSLQLVLATCGLASAKSDEFANKAVF